MRPAARNLFISRLALMILALAVLAPAFSVVVFTPTEAAAQEGVRRPWSLRDLFRTRPPSYVDPRNVFPEAPRKPRRSAKAPAEPKVPVVEKAPDARTVLVVGDFLGSGLAEGLTAVFAKNPNIKVVERTFSRSGFVRDDVFDWPEKIDGIVDEEKPAAVVVMLGANDRQQMRVGKEREPALSANWNKEYAVRTETLAKAIAARKVPFLWVGLPSFKSPKMLADMLALNDIYKAAATSAGGEFIDIWDGFVDENGAYVATGPDINGQPVRLRANDGVNLTAAGKRKVAFYTEKPLNKILGEAPLSATAPVAPSALPADVAPAVDIGSIDRTMPVSLKDPELDGGMELLGLVPEPKRTAKTPGEKLAVEGIAPIAPTGRADDFSWTPPSGQSAGASPPSVATTR